MHRADAHRVERWSWCGRKIDNCRPDRFESRSERNYLVEVGSVPLAAADLVFDVCDIARLEYKIGIQRQRPKLAANLPNGISAKMLPQYASEAIFDQLRGTD